MSIAEVDVVLAGTYVASPGEERIVRSIMNGKVYFDERAQGSNDEWTPGHTVENPPSLNRFAAACSDVLTKPIPTPHQDSV